MISANVREFSQNQIFSRSPLAMIWEFHILDYGKPQPAAEISALGSCKTEAQNLNQNFSGES